MGSSSYNSVPSSGHSGSSSSASFQFSFSHHFNYFAGFPFWTPISGSSSNCPSSTNTSTSTTTITPTGGISTTGGPLSLLNPSGQTLSSKSFHNSSSRFDPLELGEGRVTCLPVPQSKRVKSFTIDELLKPEEPRNLIKSSPPRLSIFPVPFSHSSSNSNSHCIQGKGQRSTGHTSNNISTINNISTNQTIQVTTSQCEHSSCTTSR